MLSLVENGISVIMSTQYECFVLFTVAGGNSSF